MKFNKKLGKIGNSLYVIIPKNVIETEKLTIGQTYEFEVTKNEVSPVQE